MVDNREATTTFPKHYMCERPLGYIKGSSFVQTPIDFRSTDDKGKIIVGEADYIRMVMQFSEKILNSPEWGDIRWYPSYNNKREKWEHTFFVPYPRLKYKFYHSDWPNEDGSLREVEFENFLIGGRSFRTDMETDDLVKAEEILSLLEVELQEMFDNDDLYSFHVEKLDDTALIERLDKLSSEDLCKIMNKAHKDRIYYAKKRLENEHMEVLCMQVGEKFGWEY